MLQLLRSRSGCLAGLLAALLWTSTITPLGAQAPEPAATEQAPARHAGGEASLILPDLGQVEDRRTHADDAAIADRAAVERDRVSDGDP